MAKELERDLGLFAVIAVSVGAMIGSGIFILPALAIPLTGPSVILAYLLAGLLVLPAALSKSEMATAMPEAGGTYLYIDRAMGPMMGTIAGGGTWFALSFKGALALVGGAPYIALFLDVSPVVLGLGIGLVLIAVNIVGVKQTGWIQSAIVTGMVLAMVGFIYSGMGWVEAEAYHPFVSQGGGGLLAATGLVFVSYAGVTKIASVAEEIEDPDRTIPLGMLGSLGFTTLLYVLIVYVMVGVTDPGAIAGSLTPMADAAQAFLGEAGVAVIVIAAVLALVSTANAGVLSASRYPLAMARDALAPRPLSAVSERFHTPIGAITVTGFVLLSLVAFVPVLEIAKLASAFQIMVFVLVNVALIAFREGAVEDYEPAFRSPLYPWTQLFGIAGGLVLVTQMGTLAIVGSIGIVVGGLAWYRFYARGRTRREGVAVDALRRTDTDRQVARTREEMEDLEGFRVLVPVDPSTPNEREQALLRIAADVVDEEGGEVRLIRFEEVPDQVSLGAAVEMGIPEAEKFQMRHGRADSIFGVRVHVGEVVSHHTPRALENYVHRANVDLVVADAIGRGGRLRPFRRDLAKAVREVPCDVVLLGGPAPTKVTAEVTVIADRRPFDPLKVRIANALAANAGGTVTFLHAVGVDASDAHLISIREYHDELGQLCTVPTKSIVLREADRAQALVETAGKADVIVTGEDDGIGRDGHAIEEAIDRLGEEAQRPLLIVHPEEQDEETLLTRVVEGLVYRPRGLRPELRVETEPIEEDEPAEGESQNRAE